MWPTAWWCFPQPCCSRKWPHIFWITPILCLSESIWDVVTWNPNNPNLYTHFETWAVTVAAQDLSRWQSLFLSSKAVGSAITDCLLSADYVLTKSRATKDKRPRFKETGECWLTFINWSMVLRKKEKKGHCNLIHLKAGQNNCRRNLSLREMLAIYMFEINDYQIIIYFFMNKRRK